MACESSTCSAASAVSASGLSVPECELSRSARLTRSAAPSWRSTGRRSPATKASEPSPRIVWRQMELPLMSYAADHPVNEPALPPPSAGTARAKPSGPRWHELLPSHVRNGLPSSSLPATRNGGVRLRTIWHGLASIVPDLNDRLAIVAPLISVGACSSLPTPCASDATRWPGSPTHSRMSRARGLRLQEELGSRAAPEIVEWMMGFPAGWTDLGRSAMPSSRRSPNSSAAPSSRRTTSNR